MSRRLSTIYWTTLAAAGLLIAACSPPQKTTIDVYVASSLAEAFETIEADYEEQNQQVDVRLNVAGSSTLLRQIAAGASPDVFAPADIEIFDRLTTKPTSPVEPFVTNTLTLVVPTGTETKNITTISDVINPEILVARCAAGVPCGAVTDKFLQANAIQLVETSEHLNVGQVVEHVAAGEADAGFVYRTDAKRTSDRTREIKLQNPPVVTPAIAAMSDEPEASLFAEYMISDSAQDTFANFGFGRPEE